MIDGVVNLRYYQTVMKNKPVFFQKQLHSSLSSWSSNDVFLYYETESAELDFPIKKGLINTNKFPHLNKENIDGIVENQFCIIVYLESDKTFYAINSNVTKESLADLTKKYLEKSKYGWTTQKPHDLTKKFIEQEYLEKQLKKLNGYVIPEWNVFLTPEDYQGALPDELFNLPTIQNYLDSGGCHGYIGAPERTFQTDRELLRVSAIHKASNEDLAKFIISSKGRHFADQLSSEQDVEKHFTSYFSI